VLQLAKYVNLFKLDVQHITMKSIDDQSTQEIVHYKPVEKRKHFPEMKPSKLQKADGIVSSLRHDPCSNSGQPDARSTALEGLPLRTSELREPYTLELSGQYFSLTNYILGSFVAFLILCMMISGKRSEY
jgi:hypothetical protein